MHKSEDNYTKLLLHGSEILILAHKSVCNLREN